MLRKRSQHRVALEHLGVGITDTGQLVEVIHHEEPVEAGRFGRLGLGDDLDEDVPASGVGEVRDLVAELGHGHRPLRATVARWRHPRSLRLTFQTEGVSGVRGCRSSQA